jgi:hypothetical protein
MLRHRRDNYSGVEQNINPLLTIKPASVGRADYRIHTGSGGGSTGLAVVCCLAAAPRLPTRGEGPLWPRAFRSDSLPLPAGGAAGIGAGSTSSS